MPTDGTLTVNIPRALTGSELTRDALRTRAPGENAEAEAAAARIVADVRARGDDAVLEYSKSFDRADLGSADRLVVSEEEIAEASRSLDPRLIEAMRNAADNIRAFHSRQASHGFVTTDRDGVTLGQRVIPIDSAAIYVPGGTAAYPSTLIMNVVPAKLAGVREIALATPPRPDGSIAAPILAAAALAGANRIYRMGGAQAVAALAYGTRTVRKADKIVGPGNAYVTAAKRLVFGAVDIDMIAGPSEILVIADDSAMAASVAADMLSQAEHDANAACILLTTSASLCEAVRAELARQAATLPRRDIAARSIEANARFAVVGSLSEAASLSNSVAPEHLELCVRDPFALMGAIRHAGSVFLGHYSPEAIGDYYAGPNNTLPTNGAARHSSPLSCDDFVKRSSFIYYTESALKRDMADVSVFARAEGLEGHARSVESRFSEEPRLAVEPRFSEEQRLAVEPRNAAERCFAEEPRGADVWRRAES